MSDLLTHWAVYDDCRRLAAADHAVAPDFVRVMDTQREFARLGALARGGAQWVPAILTQARGRWNDTGGHAHVERRVAFALGGIAHFAADVIMKPLMSELARAEWEAAHAAMQQERSEGAPSVREISAYYDTHVFRRVYLHGREEPFTRFLTAGNATAPGQALEEFVRALFQRALLASHTLAPPKEDFDAWLDNLFARVQPLYLDIQMYTRVFEQPDPAKMACYAVTTRFYCDDDPIVMLARAVHGGAAATPDSLDSACEERANRGGYGQAVALSLRCLRHASRFWRGESATLPDLSQQIVNRKS